MCRVLELKDDLTLEGMVGEERLVGEDERRGIKVAVLSSMFGIVCAAKLSPKTELQLLEAYFKLPNRHRGFP